MKLPLSLILAASFVGYQPPHDLDEHCFYISKGQQVRVQERLTTPEKFLAQRKDVIAAINGIAESNQRQLEGRVYYDGREFRNNRNVSGYFTITKSGKVEIAERLQGTTLDYFLIIGTYPLLVVGNTIHYQAREEKEEYQQFENRSAIGTKDGNSVCFAVSKDRLSIEEWARALQAASYRGAINLQGQEYSQMAVRDGSKIRVHGHGRSESGLIIYEIKK